MGLNYIVGLIEGLLFLVLSIGIIVYAFSLHSYGEWALSPALFPLILGGVLFCFSLTKEAIPGLATRLCFLLFFELVFLEF